MSDTRVDDTAGHTTAEADSTEGVSLEPAAAMFAVFRLSSSHPLVLDGREVVGAVQELEDVVGLVENEGVAVRGWYDVSGLRTDADLMVVLSGAAVEDLQWALRELRRTALLQPLIKTWSGAGFAQDSEAFGGSAPLQWLTVSPAWPGSAEDLLEFPDSELDESEYGASEFGAAEFGAAEFGAAEFSEAQLAGASSAGNARGSGDLDDELADAGPGRTEGELLDEDFADGDLAVHQFAAFGLGDHAWLLALEGDDLYELTTIVGELVSNDEGVMLDEPRITGRLIEPAEIVEVLQ
ncbi:chlorite dismutase family protein [Leucobacter luti]|uniref:chlorite dismutase family protein n=1 Tax=Leucobacter luti TaxID=340320 RepID=UPI003CFBD180